MDKTKVHFIPKNACSDNITVMIHNFLTGIELG